MSHIMQGTNKILILSIPKRIDSCSKLFKQKLTKQRLASVLTLYGGKTLTSRKYIQLSAVLRFFGVKDGISHYSSVRRTIWRLISSLFVKSTGMELSTLEVQKTLLSNKHNDKGDSQCLSEFEGVLAVVMEMRNWAKYDTSTLPFYQ